MVIRNMTPARLLFAVMLCCQAAYANTPDLTMNAFIVPVETTTDHSFLSFQVSQEPTNLFETAQSKSTKVRSTHFFDTHGKKISSKIRLAEQHFVSGSKAEYLLVVKRHSLFLKFQYSD